MRSYLYHILAVVAVSLLAIGTLSGSALALSLYDDFSSGAIDPAKWQNLEIVREIRNGKLVSILRAAGPPGTITNNLEFGNPEGILSFQADVRLNSYTAPVGGSVLVRLRGSLYNDGSPASGAAGDVHAVLFIRGASEGIDIRYQVYRCTNADCSTISDVIPATPVKSVGLGETHTLGIGWDGAVITFTVDEAATVVDPTLVQPRVKSTPNVPEKALGTQVIIAGAGGIGSVAGDFADVLVNTILYDDFSGPQLEAGRWATLDFVQEVADGHLVSKVAVAGPVGTRLRNRQQFANQNGVTGARADVTVTAYQSSKSSVQVRALAGSFYNSGESTGPSDATGDVEALLRISSATGRALTVEFLTNRCMDAQCSATTLTTLFTDTLGTINAGETHTLALVWDGSVFTYGLDAVVRTYDPKTVVPVGKPPTEHYKDLRTDTNVEAEDGYGYIAATFDNIYVNDEASAPQRLTPFLQETVTGDVTSAGVGLRGLGTGTISVTGIPPGATVRRALLYWATLGTTGTFTSPTLNTIPVAGTLIGQSDDPLWGAWQCFAYRADVTSLVSGNGTYTVAGLPKDGPTLNDSQGASLVVIYSLPGAPSRVISINDGAVALVASRMLFSATTLGGFIAAEPPTGARLTFIVGDGESFTPESEYAGINAAVLDVNEFDGGDGHFWDTRTYDASAAIAGGAMSADAIVSTGTDSLVWVAAILSVPGTSSNPTLALSVNHPSFHPGEQLTLNVTVTPGAASVSADVYVAVQLPDGTLLFLQGDGSLTATLQPIVRNWSVGAFTGQLFSYTLGGGEPVGNYAWLAAFTWPGTLNFIGPIISAPFSFGP